MRNVTIVLEEKVADWARVEAAKRRTSLSRMVGEMLAEKMRQEEAYEGAMRQARGPKTNYRRTEEMVRQIIRHRFLDPDASAEVIAQKLQQAHHLISIRSVERVISDFGLQKKTLRLSP